MKFLPLVLLLSAFSPLALSHVVSFTNTCPSFFVRNPANNDIVVPTIFSGRQYKTICQRWRNQYRFATVYDTVRRIPVYSAYTFLQNNRAERNDWKIEPQLENIEEYKNNREMIVSPRDIATVNQIINQAVDLDYAGAVTHTRGHVYPNQYAADQDQADSTFTLTNIAPQTQASNGRWADKVETPMLQEIKDICKLDQNHLAYVVTGVVPGNTWISITRNQKSIDNGINIPSHFWSAFCCTDNKNIKNFVFRAYLATLDNFKLKKYDIAGLNKQLSTLYGKDFTVFPGL